MLGVEGEKIENFKNRLYPVKITENLKLVSMAFLLESADSAVIWRGPMKMKVIQQFLGEVMWGELDWLIIDSPPGTGDEPLSVAQLIPATGGIVVTTPQEVSLMDSRKAIQFGYKLGLKIFGVIENMSGMICPHCGQKTALFKEGGGEVAAKEMQVPFLGRVPIDPEIVSLGDDGKSFVNALPDSLATKALLEITEKILNGV
jgi:Mrp family chromosome partitioning ATPase